MINLGFPEKRVFQFWRFQTSKDGDQAMRVRWLTDPPPKRVAVGVRPAQLPGSDFGIKKKKRFSGVKNRKKCLVKVTPVEKKCNSCGKRVISRTGLCHKSQKKVIWPWKVTNDDFRIYRGQNNFWKNRFQAGSVDSLDFRSRP